MADQTPQSRVTLPGSERNALEGAQALGPVDPHETIEVSVYLRPSTTSNLAQDIENRVVRQQKPLSREEYAASHSASPDDILLVERFALDYNLLILEADAVRRVVRLSGSAEAINAAFETQLQNYNYQGSTYRARTGTLTIPAQLASVVTGVFGIDNRPQAYSRRIKASATPSASYTPPQLAQLYDFPKQGNGSGQTIGIIELGGGYRPEDLTTYFGQLRDSCANSSERLRRWWSECSHYSHQCRWRGRARYRGCWRCCSWRKNCCLLRPQYRCWLP